MIDYISSKIAYREHEERVQAHLLAQAFNAPAVAGEPGWVSKQVGHVLSAVGASLTTVGMRLNHGWDEKQKPNSASN